MLYRQMKKSGNDASNDEDSMSDGSSSDADGG